MFNKVEIQQGRRLVTAYQLNLFAFTTKKGTFTLSGTSSDGTDEWKHLETRTFHTWTREQVYHWFIQGNISPISEAKTLNWYTSIYKGKISR